jgi:hypothetical protein
MNPIQQLETDYAQSFPLNAQTFKAFSAARRRGFCTLGEDLLPSFLKPVFLPQAWRASIAADVELVVTALEKLCCARLTSDRLQSALPMDAQLLDLARIDPGYRGIQLVLRLDTLLDMNTGEFKILEFNCGDPSGMGWNDALLHIALEQLAAQESLHSRWKFQGDRLCDGLGRLLWIKYREYCDRRHLAQAVHPLTALVCKRGSMISADFQAIALALEAQGFAAEVVDPGDLNYDGKLRFQGRPVDLVYRDIVDDFLGPKAGVNSSALLHALRAQNVCLLNPLASAAGDFKNINALLRSPDLHSLFTPAEQAAIERTIPWTAPLSATNLSQALVRQSELVLKPNLGFGGQGVMIGRECDSEQWARAVLQGLEHDSTLQEFVTIPSLSFPTEDGFRAKKVNVNFWVQNYRFAGAFARVADQSVINICQGGGLVPILWAKETY